MKSAHSKDLFGYRQVKKKKVTAESVDYLKEPELGRVKVGNSIDSRKPELERVKADNSNGSRKPRLECVAEQVGGGKTPSGTICGRDSRS